MAVPHFPTLLPCRVMLYSCTRVSLLGFLLLGTRQRALVVPGAQPRFRSCPLLLAGLCHTRALHRKGHCPLHGWGSPLQLRLAAKSSVNEDL